MTDTTIATEATSTPDAAVASETQAEVLTLATGAEDTQAKATTEADKPADGEAKTEGEETKEGDDKPAPKAPESYADFTLPEGITLDPAVAEDLKALAKELDLPQDQAQKIANLGAKQAAKFAEQQAAVVIEAGQTWLGEVKADKELGGDHFKGTSEAVSKAMGQFSTPEFKALLNQTQLGNHPEFVRFAARIGKAISDDIFVAGGKTVKPQATLAERLYPTKQ